LLGQHKCFLADHAIYGAVNDALELNYTLNLNFVRYQMLVDWVIDVRSGRTGADIGFGQVMQQKLADKFPEIRNTNDLHIEKRISKWCEKISKLLSDRGDVHLNFVLCGGGMLHQRAFEKYKQIIETKCPGVVIVDGRSSRPRYAAYSVVRLTILLTISSESTVLRGLQEFAENCERSKDATAPIAILQRTDVSSSDNPAHVVLVNKGDGLNPGTLLPCGQPERGELITIMLQWTDDNVAKIPIYAVHEPLDLDQLEIENDLLTTPGDYTDENLFLIGKVEIQRNKIPDGVDLSRAYLASWPNPYGRTIRTVLYMLGENENDIDPAGSKIREKAKFTIDEIHGLDTFSVQYRKQGKRVKPHYLSSERGESKTSSNLAQKSGRHSGLIHSIH
jgi:hypothetical protein